MMVTTRRMDAYRPVNPPAFAAYRPINPPAFADDVSPTDAAMVGSMWSRHVVPGICIGVSVYVITRLIDKMLFGGR
jgi:hypothetical protein